ncbi:MAG: phosphate ABC transporter permease PstA [Pseudomonadales bacterium]|nr:phosphate ABC transporter permease PstA [Pseudomonadales bacterium]
MQTQKPTLASWFKGGSPWVWMNAAAVSVSIIAVIGLLFVLAVNGLSHFWPSNIIQAEYQIPGREQSVTIIGEIVDTVDVSSEQLVSAGIAVDPSQAEYQRSLLKLGNRDVTGADFGWFVDIGFSALSYPEDLMVLERREWGNFYGRLVEVLESGDSVAVVDANAYEASYESVWQSFLQRLARAEAIHEQIHSIEKHDIGAINYEMERLRLKQRKFELDGLSGQALAQAVSDIDASRALLNSEYAALQEQLEQLYREIGRDSIRASVQDGQIREIKLAHIVAALRPNHMSMLDKMQAYMVKLWAFLTEDPREANTEGGIYPAIFGTVMMVLLMSVMVTPFGVIAAVYLREYASQGVITRTIRIAVNNLAGVPSIVYGVFGLGFFIYFIGEHIDHAMFPEALPSPTFGTPGLLWASLTLALLTLPVVIVATEEGLARIPRSVKEGSLALGATKFETITKVVLPMASPAMMTGLILAVARAAGEVAPLMLVGVVKLAPSLPLDGNYPFLHLDQKFMHLGFHIYDVGFQSPNVEAARPLVYATAFLLVVVIALLNFSAVAIRNHLREKYKALEH